MKRTTTAFFSIIIISLLFSAYIIITSKTPVEYPLELTQQHIQAQTFLTDIIGLDPTKYTLTLQPTEPSIQEYDENNQIYKIESTTNNFTATIEYKNSNLTKCKISGLKEPTQLAQYSQDPLKIAKDFVSRYKDFSQKPYMTQIQQILNQITNVEPTTIVSDSGEILMKIIQKDPYLTFQWQKIIKGIENEYNQFNLILKDNCFYTSHDTWESYTIIDAEIKISRSQAISLTKAEAMNEKQRYWYDGKFIRPLSIADEPHFVELRMRQRNHSGVFPCWSIRFILVGDYPGYKTVIEAFIWADTGAINIQSTGNLLE